MDDMTPHWPKVNEDDKADLMAERRRLINCLAAVEEALREKHGYTVSTINPQTVPPGGELIMSVLSSLFSRDVADEPPPPESATHVLAYLPAYLHKGSDTGAWELMATHIYEDGGSQEDPGWVFWGNADADPAELATFAFRLLGYPVSMDLRHAMIYALPRVRSTREPVYYLTPVI